MGAVALAEERDRADRDGDESPEDDKVHPTGRLFISEKFSLAKRVDKNGPNSFPNSIEPVLWPGSAEQEKAAINGVAENSGRDENQSSEKKRGQHARDLICHMP